MAARSGTAGKRHAVAGRPVVLDAARRRPAARPRQPACRHLASAAHRLRLELAAAGRAVRRGQGRRRIAADRILSPQSALSRHRVRRNGAGAARRCGRRGALPAGGRPGEVRLHRVRRFAAERRGLPQRGNGRDAPSRRLHRRAAQPARPRAGALRSACRAPYRAAHRAERARRLSRRPGGAARAQRVDQARRRRADPRGDLGLRPARLHRPVRAPGRSGHGCSMPISRRWPARCWRRAAKC